MPPPAQLPTLRPPPPNTHSCPQLLFYLPAEYAYLKPRGEFLGGINLASLQNSALAWWFDPSYYLFDNCQCPEVWGAACG